MYPRRKRPFSPVSGRRVVRDVFDNTPKVNPRPPSSPRIRLLPLSQASQRRQPRDSSVDEGDLRTTTPPLPSISKSRSPAHSSPPGDSLQERMRRARNDTRSSSPTARSNRRSPSIDAKGRRRRQKSNVYLRSGLRGLKEADEDSSANSREGTRKKRRSSRKRPPPNGFKTWDEYYSARLQKDEARRKEKAARLRDLLGFMREKRTEREAKDAELRKLLIEDGNSSAQDTKPRSRRQRSRAASRHFVGVLPSTMLQSPTSDGEGRSFPADRLTSPPPQLATSPPDAERKQRNPQRVRRSAARPPSSGHKRRISLVEQQSRYARSRKPSSKDLKVSTHTRTSSKSASDRSRLRRPRSGLVSPTRARTDGGARGQPGGTNIKSSSLHRRSRSAMRSDDQDRGTRSPASGSRYRANAASLRPGGSRSNRKQSSPTGSLSRSPIYGNRSKPLSPLRRSAGGKQSGGADSSKTGAQRRARTTAGASGGRRPSGRRSHQRPPSMAMVSPVGKDDVVKSGSDGKNGTAGKPRTRPGSRSSSVRTGRPGSRSGRPGSRSSTRPTRPGSRSGRPGSRSRRPGSRSGRPGSRSRGGVPAASPGTAGASGRPARPPDQRNTNAGRSSGERPGSRTRGRRPGSRSSSRGGNGSGGPTGSSQSAKGWGFARSRGQQTGSSAKAGKDRMVPSTGPSPPPAGGGTVAGSRSRRPGASAGTAPVHKSGRELRPTHPSNTRGTVSSQTRQPSQQPPQSAYVVSSRPSTRDGTGLRLERGTEGRWSDEGSPDRPARMVAATDSVSDLPSPVVLDPRAQSGAVIAASGTDGNTQQTASSDEHRQDGNTLKDDPESSSHHTSVEDSRDADPVTSEGVNGQPDADMPAGEPSGDQTSEQEVVTRATDGSDDKSRDDGTRQDTSSQPSTSGAPVEQKAGEHKTQGSSAVVRKRTRVKPGSILVFSSVDGLTVDEKTEDSEKKSEGTGTAGGLSSIHNMLDNLPLRNNVTCVSVGVSHCGLVTAQHTLYMWGSNLDGQLGLGDALARQGPTLVSLPKVPSQYGPMMNPGVTQVVCGYRNTFCIDEDGFLYSWGSGMNGVLGHKRDVDVDEPKRCETVSESLFVTFVASGEYNTGFIAHPRKSQTPEAHTFLYVWGSGESGQCGQGDKQPHLSPVRVHLDNKARAEKAVTNKGLVPSGLSFGNRHVVACTQDGRAYSWGSNQFGQLGYESDSLQLTPTLLSRFYLLGHRVRSVHCGERHTSVVTKADGVFSFGSGETHQLGILENEDVFNPVAVSLPAVRELSVGQQVTCAVTYSGHVYSWGFGVGQAVPTISAKTSAASADFIRSAQIGDNDTCVLLTGTAEVVWTWDMDTEANDLDGEEGEEGEEDWESPVTLVTAKQVDRLRGKRVRQCAAGSVHQAVSTETGLVMVWGDNTDGILGTGNDISLVIPLSLPSLPKEVVQVVCGQEHSMALTASGQVFAWGVGTFGKLGTGRDRDEDKPQLVSALDPDEMQGDRVTHLVISAYNSGCITDEGSMYVWGAGGDGQLGDGGWHPAFAPKRFPSADAVLLGDGGERKQGTASGWASLSFGEKHAAAVTSTGVVFTWGNNDFGQLGYEEPRVNKAWSQDTGKLSLPHAVFYLQALGARVSQVCASDVSTFFLSQAGTVYACGSGETKQLGNGVFDDQWLPAPCTGAMQDEVVRRIDVGPLNCAAITEAGNCYVWGWDAGMLPRKAVFPEEEGALVKDVSVGKGVMMFITE